jgi:hypothetical protein
LLSPALMNVESGSRALHETSTIANSVSVAIVNNFFMVCLLWVP